MKLKELVIAAFVVALLGGLGYIWFGPEGGEPAPALQVNTLDGDPLALQALAGRPVLVTFWATNCPGCIKEIPHLAQLHHELGPQGLTIIGVAMHYDEPDHVRQMVARRAIPYPIVHDSEAAAARAFGNVKLTPTHILISPQGRIVQRRLGEWDIDDLRRRIEAMLPGEAA